MFPTSGYFRAVQCPFYTNGLCERPYCHFRHTKQEEKRDNAKVGKFFFLIYKNFIDALSLYNFI